jgi:hypothetical protein
MSIRSVTQTAACLLLAAACAPTLDWREVRPDGSGAVAWFPCRPDRYARVVALAGEQVRLTLHACGAGGATWALAHADLTDPLRVSQALDDLRSAATANLAAATVRPLGGRIDGETPNPKAGRFEFDGQLPDGTKVREQLAVFAKGTRVFQATVLGAHLDEQALEAFFDGLRVRA